MADNNSTDIKEKEYILPNPSTKLYALKIAVFNTFMFCLVAFTDTVTRHLEKSHDISTVQFSCWLFIAAIICFFGNYFLQLKLRSIPLSIIGSFIFTVAVGFVISFAFFGPIQRNFDQMIAFASFPSSSVIAAFVRFSPIRSDFLTDRNIEFQSKIEWLKEYSNLMRTVAISGGIAYFAFIMTWFNYMWQMVNRAFQDNFHEVAFVHGLFAFQAFGISLYVLLGPLYECFRKAKIVRDMFLDIRK
jgi:hypothetical protein